MDTSQYKGCVHYDFLSTFMGYDGAKGSYYLHTPSKRECQQLYHQKIKSGRIRFNKHSGCALQDIELLCRRDSKIYTRRRISDDCCIPVIAAFSICPTTTAYSEASLRHHGCSEGPVFSMLYIQMRH